MTFLYFLNKVKTKKFNWSNFFGNVLFEKIKQNFHHYVILILKIYSLNRYSVQGSLKIFNRNK